MSNLEQYIKLQKEKKDINEKISIVKKDLIEDICPYKIGDIVEVMGYSHKGKKCRITDLFIQESYFSKLKIKVKGIVINKNGEESRFQTNWDSYHDPKLKEAIKTSVGELAKELQLL